MTSAARRIEPQHEIFSLCTYIVLPSAISANRLILPPPLEEVTLTRRHHTIEILTMEGGRWRFEESDPAKLTATTTDNGTPIRIPEEAQLRSLGIFRSEVRADLGEGRRQRRQQGGRRSRERVGVYKYRLHLCQSSPIVPYCTQRPLLETEHPYQRGRGQGRGRGHRVERYCKRDNYD